MLHRRPRDVLDFPDAARRALSVQFNTIVRTSSYAELVRRMRERVAELTAPPASTLSEVRAAKDLLGVEPA